MIKDSEILKELWKEIGKPLPQLKSDMIFRTGAPGYAVNEKGYVKGMNLHEIENLKAITITLVKFEH